MKKPKMILFDYGQTLCAEEKFDGLRGTRAVLQYAVENKYGYTAEDVQREADEINRELGRSDFKQRHLREIESPNFMFSAYLYASMGIRLSLSAKELDRVFWHAASPARPTEGIQDFLAYLKAEHIRTAVLSNISYNGELVREHICGLLPENDFEFILATSDYLFRKPNPRIFRLALEKAGLAPEDVWYIGDSYECDICGARAVGMFPVWYLGAAEPPAEAKDDVLTVTSWQALMAYLVEK